jgi:hypothetical protein
MTRAPFRPRHYCCRSCKATEFCLTTVKTAKTVSLEDSEGMVKLEITAIARVVQEFSGLQSEALAVMVEGG